MLEEWKARESRYGVPRVKGRIEMVFCWFLYRTIWYEMCSGSWPFKKQIPEAIIWQVGKGMKQSLANVDVPREVKVCFFTPS